MQPLCPAYILHSRPFQDNKLLLQLLMPERGRVSAVIRKRQGKQRFALQPFQLFTVALGGRSSLKTVLTLDELAPAVRFNGKFLFSALYLNELICRLWPDDMAAEQLFNYYQQSLTALDQAQQQPDNLEPCLREFEFSLLGELGLQVDWQHGADGAPLLAELQYLWQPEQGFVVVSRGWPGSVLQAIGQHNWQHTDALKVAKQVSRQLLTPLLGGKPLHSRALFNPLG
ncbi:MULTISPECIES: DNA repair protein RecO [unclassified Arsukibacterium]|uniref:DNA repair protein RecO n=1 Tax=unclassified Arsukibacterium TaxID=2635278 RepID=UPI000C963855|nr:MULTISPECIES: DNA repair protein RecO [unclassified Arsukibacterium]MAA94966.1 DNA repair protein RecO [Rheinheimera sp.]HAW92372.1 DNA repair protein RecO [Candidatus Azambacteria bacterium]|tara:strand:+ start:251391 stop:252074 length:684 start_codon:yes stop_codon:yes gene_type:complete